MLWYQWNHPLLNWHIVRGAFRRRTPLLVVDLRRGDMPVAKQFSIGNAGVFGSWV
jgi:hypothetical protein